MGTASLNIIEIPSNPSTPANLYLAYAAKHPADTMSLTISAARILGVLGRTIVGLPTVTCSGLTIVDVAESQGLTTFQASGGTDGSTYGITWSAVLDDASTLTRDFWLPVLSQFLNTQTSDIIAKGDDGVSPTLAMGTITTLSPGVPGTADVREVSPGAYALDIGLPVGAINQSAITAATETAILADAPFVAEVSATALAAVPTQAITTSQPATQSINGTATTTQTLTIAQGLAIIVNNSLTIDQLENRNDQGITTTGIYASATRAAAMGGTANATALINLGVQISAQTNGPRFVITPGAYSLYGGATGSMTTKAKNSCIQIIPNARIVATPEAVITSAYNNSGFDGILTTSALSVSCDNFRLEGGITLQRLADTWVDYFTNIITTNVENKRTVCAGYWSGLTNYLPQNTGNPNGGWQTSAAYPFQATGQVVHFDTLPPGFSTLGQLIAALPSVVTVVCLQYWCSDSYCHPATDITPNPTIGGFDMVLTGGTLGGQSPAPNLPFQWNSLGAIPAQIAVPRSGTSPEIMARGAIGAPVVQFLSGPPAFYQGNGIVFLGNDGLLDSITVRNITNGRSGFIGGDRLLVPNFKCRTTDGMSGSAGLRPFGGKGSKATNPSCYSGDAAVQTVVGNNYTAQGFDQHSNLDVEWEIVNQDAFSLHGSGNEIACVIADNEQTEPWLTQGITQVGNTITLMSPVPSPLTLAQLQASEPPWSPFTAYPTVGAIICNGPSNYQLTQAGTSGGDGPVGNGTLIPDGTCLWTQLGAGDTQYLSRRNSVVAGSFVLGQTVVQNGDGSISMSLQPPPGSANAVAVSMAAGSTVYFQAGLPVQPLTCSQRVKIIGGKCGSAGLGALYVQNPDSTGTIDFLIDGVTYDETYKFHSRSGSDSAIRLAGAGIFGDTNDSLPGGGYAGVLRDIKVVDPWDRAITTKGRGWKLEVSGQIAPPRNTATVDEPVQILGVKRGRWSATVFASGVAAHTIQIGGPNATENSGIIDANTTSNFEIDGEVYGTAPGFACVHIIDGVNCSIGAYLGQAAALGTGAALGVLLEAGAIGTSFDNALLAFDGAALSGAGTATIGFGNRLVPGAGTTLPSPSISIGGVSYDFAGYLQNIPQTLPGTTGTPWLNTGSGNGGVLSVTDGPLPTGVTLPVVHAVSGSGTFDFAAFAQTLPTSLPGTSGQPWKNSGEIAVS